MRLFIRQGFKNVTGLPLKAKIQSLSSFSSFRRFNTEQILGTISF